jgi:hypothetical protein
MIGMDDDEFLRAPWTFEQVEALNAYQGNEMFHPYTHTCIGDVNRILHATPNGWRCAFCPYEQDWAHRMSVAVHASPSPALGRG